MKQQETCHWCNANSGKRPRKAFKLASANTSQGWKLICRVCYFERKSNPFITFKPLAKAEK